MVIPRPSLGPAIINFSPVAETDLSLDNPESTGSGLGCHPTPAWEGVKEGFLEEGLSNLHLEDEEAVRKESSPEAQGIIAHVPQKQGGGRELGI